MVWPFPSPPLIPVVRLEGMIAAARPGLNLASLEPTLHRAFQFAKAPAVALSINSPGGSAVQSHLIVKRIRQLAAQKKKQVLAFVEDVGASGGYMLACAADEIFVDPSSLVGSIGVIGGGFGFPELMQKLGVERRVHTAGAVKGRLDPFRPESPDDVRRLDEILKEVHAAFIAIVRERRAGKLKETPMLFEGEIFTAREAIEVGLVDALGDLNGVLAARWGKDVRIRKMPVGRMSLLRRLMGGAGDALLSRLEERAAFARYGV
ncbi:MAG: S49 family peptidase [Hyphomonadaceae bacterium]|nr:S49 family peptidase [Hyphomonadaceae bacterium]